MKYGIIFLCLGFLLVACVWIFESLAAQSFAGFSAIGFFAIGFGYLFKSPAVWMKRRDGSISPLSFGLFLPLHLLNWLSFQLAARRAKYPARHEIAPKLWLGRRLFAHEVKALLAGGSWAVVDLTAEFQEVRELRITKYLCLPTLDHTAPTLSQVETALQFIAGELPSRQVFVHCALGHGRSATVVAAWMLRNKLATTAEESDGKLRKIRSGVRLKKSQLRLLDAMFSRE